MSSYAHLGLLVLLVIIPASTGYGGAAPNDACVDMSPHHGTVEETSPNNFSLYWTRETTQGNDILKGRSNTYDAYIESRYTILRKYVIICVSEFDGSF